MSVQRRTHDDVQGHKFYSDEDLKQAITQINDALDTLRSIDTASDDDVEGHRMWSDEDLKQTITRIPQAVAALVAVGTLAR